MTSSGPRILAAALCIAAMAFGAAAQTARSNSLVVIFKDGHQKAFSISDVSRIELNPLRIVLKNGHQESLSTDEVVRLEMKDSADNGVLGRNHFVGKWKVGNGAGSYFFITLERDGAARKTIGASHGTWDLIDGEARIKWDDGWHDAIRKVGDKHEKRAFGPGKSFDDDPDNVTDAQNTTAQPI